MRFFIGYDMREPKAYGIYRDEEGNFIVYKNKSNGSKSVRYKGSDEAYAVNEIYQKLRTEMAELKMAYAEDTNHTDDAYNPRRYLSRNAGKMSFIPVMIIFAVTIMIIVTVMLLFSNVSSKFQDSYEEKRWNYTYYNNGSWSDGVWEQDDSWDDDYYDNSYDYDDWADDWDGDDWDFDSDWNDSYSDWDSDW